MREHLRTYAEWPCLCALIIAFLMPAFASAQTKKETQEFLMKKVAEQDQVSANAGPARTLG